MNLDTDFWVTIILVAIIAYICGRTHGESEEWKRHRELCICHECSTWQEDNDVKTLASVKKE